VPQRARHPLALLAICAAVPTVALAALVVFANGRADDVAVPSSTSIATPLLPAALPTPLLSVRRAPTPLAADRRHDVLASASTALTKSVDGTSCVALGLDDEPLVAENATVKVIPASNLKVVTAAAAVEVLGPGTVFTTKVVGPAPVGGVVAGDVYLVGGGDPVLSEQWYTQPSATRKRPPVHATGFEALADAMASAGITRITGQVLGDGSRYDDERHPPGWSSAIRASADGVPVGALVVNDSISQSGGIASDPAKSAAQTLRRLLRDRGIQVGGAAGTGPAPDGSGTLATVTSAPLSDIVNEMLVTSDNLTAEMLVKEIGVTTAQQGTREAGLAAVSARMVEWGVPVDQFALADGSGLSRENLITCDGLLRVLQRGSRTDVVGGGLARAGQAGSTLDGKFEQAGLKDVLQAKTGSLSGVKALCGYMPVSDAHDVEFVLILNGASAADFAGPWDVLGQLLLAVADAPTAADLAPPQI
jgi:D-alanyl-D-alanine carboxypeptidase/D-alanyl-D-alanine-endopeptidase (penicillin-binding protein 4)